MSRTAALAVVLIAGTFALVACDKPPPPAPKAPEPAASAPPPPPAPVEDRVQRAAAEAYVYGYPLVLTDVAREMRAAEGPGLRAVRAADPTGANAVDPNEDFVYAQGWLDLSRGPVVLDVPDLGGRYYLVTLVDAWSNVAASLGTRTTGAGKASYAFVGPRAKAELPGGSYEVRSPTDLAWVLARIEVRGPADRAAAQKLLAKFALRPLGKATGPAKPDAHRDAAGSRGTRAPAGAPDTAQARVAAMDATTFLARLASLLGDNPPAAEDAAVVATLAEIGIVPGKPFDAKSLDANRVQKLDAGVAAARKALSGASALATVEFRSGWAVDRSLGRFGTDYGKRAVTAERGLGANAPEDAILFVARLDGSGRKLDGRQRYLLRFDAATRPPVDGFWSLSLYDEQGRFPGNAADRHHLSSSEVAPGPDGAIEVRIQPTDPGGAGPRNWLPTPEGPFHLVLRLYAPRAPVQEGRWNAPGLRAGE